MTSKKNEALNEITYLLTGNLDLEQSLIKTRDYLRKFMPIDEVFLIWISEAEQSLHILLRISADNVVNNQMQFLCYLDEITEYPTGTQIGEEADVFIESEIKKHFNPRADSSHFSAETNAGQQLPHDSITLFDSRLKTGFAAVSYRENAYNKHHVRLFNSLKRPFCIALENAVNHLQVRRQRELLAEDNQLFRDVTIRLVNESNIARSFQNALVYLQQYVPLVQIIVASAGIEGGPVNKRILFKVTKDSITEDADWFTDYTGEEETQYAENMVSMPRVSVHKLPSQTNERFDIASTDELIVVANKHEKAAIILAFNDDSLPSKPISRNIMQVVELLKEPLTIALSNAIRVYHLEYQKKQLLEDNIALQRDVCRTTSDRVIGMQKGLRNVMNMVAQVCQTHSPVLILGETGSGKEVIAQAIHRMSELTGPFVSLNCGAIPESLIDSELFGHERGAFTGATERKRGRFERAEHGTLFLDEVGELPLSAQVRLLRVLQEKEFERIGGNKTMQTNVRLIAATNRDLPLMVENGRFRKDLWFRLNVFPIHIPPLRERRQDIPLLAYHFVENRYRQLNLPFRPSIPEDAMQRLQAYNWPGNVRELQNQIERELILCKGDAIHFSNLNGSAICEPDINQDDSNDWTAVTHDDLLRKYFRAILAHTNGRVSGPKGAALIAGMHPNTFRSKVCKLGIN